MLFSFEMSRISNSISVSNSFAVLLDDSLKENQTLREKLRQCDEENAVKFQELTNKVDSLCKTVADNNSGNKETKSKSSSKVHVPTRCRVKPIILLFFSARYCLFLLIRPSCYAYLVTCQFTCHSS